MSCTPFGGPCFGLCAVIHEADARIDAHCIDVVCGRVGIACSDHVSVILEDACMTVVLGNHCVPLATFREDRGEVGRQFETQSFEEWDHFCVRVEFDVRALYYNF